MHTPANTYTHTHTRTLTHTHTRLIFKYKSEHKQLKQVINSNTHWAWFLEKY